MRRLTITLLCVAMVAILAGTAFAKLSDEQFNDLKKRITECRERRIAIAGELRRTLEGIMPYVFPRLSTTSSTGEDEEYKELLEALGKNKDDNSKTKEQAGDIQQA